MNLAEQIVREDFEQKGFNVYKNIRLGMPDFTCSNDRKKFYVEVKSLQDDITTAQLLKIGELNSQGHEVFLTIVKRFQSIKKFQINVTLQEIADYPVGMNFGGF